VSIRQVAAISIAGWFLMTAPITNQGVDQSAPLAEWKRAKHFDSETECDSERRDAIRATQDQSALAPNSEIDQDNKRDTGVALDEAVSAQCIADNDQRISGQGGVDDSLGRGMLRKMVPH